MAPSNSNFGAACLPREMPSLHGRHCWVAGWGVGTEGGSAQRLLNEVGVNVFSHQYCVNKSIYGNFIIEEAEICAGIPDRNNDGLADGGKDACQGDSGKSITPGRPIPRPGNLASVSSFVKSCDSNSKSGVLFLVFASKTVSHKVYSVFLYTVSFFHATHDILCVILIL